MSCRALFVSSPKTCQNCGVEFPCGSLCCWCGEIKIDKAVREELKQKFNDCLCRTCLEEAQRLGPQAQAQGPRAV